MLILILLYHYFHFSTVWLKYPLTLKMTLNPYINTLFLACLTSVSILQYSWGDLFLSGISSESDIFSQNICPINFFLFLHLAFE